MSKRYGPIVNDKDELSQEEIANAVEYPDVIRPKKRGDCWNEEGDFPKGSVPRPCPFVSCRYNNFLRITENGTIILTHATRDPTEVPPDESCALDVAERGGTTFEELAELLDTSKSGAEKEVYAAQEHAREIRKKLLRKIK